MSSNKKDKTGYNINELCLSFIPVSRYYTVVLGKMAKIPLPLVKTMAVGFLKTGKIALFYNPKFMTELPMGEAQGVLRHECDHIAFRHLSRHPMKSTSIDLLKDGGLTIDKLNKALAEKHINELLNIGTDMSINQYIDVLPTFKANHPAVLAGKKKVGESMGYYPETEGFDRGFSSDVYIELLKKKFPTPPSLPKPQCQTCGGKGKLAPNKQQQQNQQGQNGQQPQQQQGQGNQQQQGQGDQQSQDQQQNGQGQGQQDQNQQGQQQSQGQGDQQGQDQNDQGQGQQNQQGQNGQQSQDQNGQQGQGNGEPSFSPANQHGQGGDQPCPDCGGTGQGQMSLDSHDLWGKVVEIDENGNVTISDVKDNPDIDPEFEQESIILKSVKECQNSKDRGSIPAHILAEVEKMRKVKKHDWKKTLRVFVNTVLTVNKRRTQKKVDRRLSTIVDYIEPGKKKARKPKLLYVRDSSGSMFAEEVQKDINNELSFIAKRADVYVADCDTEIKQCYRYKQDSDLKPFQGGGGTSFEPAFELAKKLGVDGIIYATDTYGSFPKKGDIGKLAMNTIWLTFDQKEVKLPFGKHVNIDPEEYQNRKSA